MRLSHSSQIDACACASPARRTLAHADEIDNVEGSCWKFLGSQSKRKVAWASNIFYILSLLSMEPFRALRANSSSISGNLVQSKQRPVGKSRTSFSLMTKIRLTKVQKSLGGLVGSYLKNCSSCKVHQSRWHALRIQFQVLKMAKELWEPSHSVLSGGNGSLKVMKKIRMLSSSSKGTGWNKHEKFFKAVASKMKFRTFFSALLLLAWPKVQQLIPPDTMRVLGNWVAYTWATCHPQQRRGRTVKDNTEHFHTLSATPKSFCIEDVRLAVTVESNYNNPKCEIRDWKLPSCF